MTTLFQFLFLRLAALYLLCLLCAPSWSYAQSTLDSLSLEDLVELARQQTLQSKEARLNLEVAQLSYQNYRAGLKPQLVGNANFPNYAKTFSETTQPDGTVRFQPILNNNSAVGLSLTQAITSTGGTLFVDSDLQRFDDFENDQSFYNGLPIRIGFLQPIGAFNPLKWAKKIEPVRLKEAKKQYFLDRESSIGRTTALFFQLLIAQQNLNIAITNKESNQKLFEIANERYELGQISYNNLLQLKLELAAAAQQTQSALQSVRNTSADIYALLGQTFDGKIIKAKMPVLTELEIELATALEEALQNRADLDRHQRLILESDRAISQAKRDNGFQAQLSASFGFARSAQNLQDIYTDAQQEQLVQFQLQIPILDWGRRKSAVGIAQVRKTYTQALIQQERLNLKVSLQQLVDQFNSLKQELNLIQEVKNIAEERFKISQESFVLGAISITDLSIAQQEKDRAVRGYLSTLGQYWQTYYELRTSALYDFKNDKKIIQ
ncbi:MAG: TolC family protein [Saprospiraceae bacterium]